MEREQERERENSSFQSRSAVSYPVCPFTVYEAWNEESSTIQCDKASSFKHVATLLNYFTSNYMK